MTTKTFHDYSRILALNLKPMIGQNYCIHTMYTYIHTKKVYSHKRFLFNQCNQCKKCNKFDSRKACVCKVHSFPKVLKKIMLQFQ